MFQDWVPFFKTIWWVSFKPKRFFSGLANEKGFIGTYYFQDFSSFICRYVAAVAILNLLIVKYLSLSEYVPPEMPVFSGFLETLFFNVVFVVWLFFSAAILHFYVSLRIKMGVDGVKRKFSESFVYSTYLLALFFVPNATMVPFFTIFENAVNGFQVIILLFLYLLYMVILLVSLFKTGPIAFSELYRTKKAFAGWSWFISIIFVALINRLINSVLAFSLSSG
tara:strand:- start:6814 stop:7482 length:669 start_codon:yes stop_codon:yes gene_type:complete